MPGIGSDETLSEREDTGLNLSCEYIDLENNLCHLIDIEGEEPTRGRECVCSLCKRKLTEKRYDQVFRTTEEGLKDLWKIRRDLSEKDYGQERLLGGLKKLHESLAQLEWAETERKVSQEEMLDNQNHLRAQLENMNDKLSSAIEIFIEHSFSRTEKEQAHLLTILDSIEDIIFVVDPENHEILFANEAVKREFGDVVGRECYRAVLGMDSPCDFCTEKTTWEGRNPKNGKWYRCTGKPIQWSDGRQVCLEIALDITEKNNRVRQGSGPIIERANEAIITVDREGIIRHFNPAAEDLFGHRENEVVGRSLELIIPERDRERFRKGMKMLTDGDRAPALGRPMELTGLKKDGTEFPIEHSLFSWTTDVDTFSSCIIRDLSERKIMEKELIDTKNRMESIIKGIPDGVLLLDRDYRIIWANQAIEYTTGHSGREVLGEHCYEVIRQRDEPCGPDIECPLEIIKRSGEHVRLRQTHFDTDGNEYYVEVSAFPVRDDDGEIVQYVHVTQDLSNWKWADEELRKAFKELETLDQLKIDIISNLSHELRTPLTVAQGSVELALTMEDPAVRRNLLHKTMAAIDRQNHIIENLVSISHIYADTYDVLPGMLSLERVVNDALIDVSNGIEDKKLKIITDFEEDLPAFRGDGQKLQLALVNLFDNAVKFNRDGGEMVVSVRHDDSGLHLMVSDQGPGITKDDRERIFMPLTQLDTSIKRKYGGTGTGLAVTKHIVELHGGRIWVEDNHEGGSIFRVSLPLDGTGNF